MRDDAISAFSSDDGVDVIATLAVSIVDGAFLAGFRKGNSVSVSSLGESAPEVESDSEEHENDSEVTKAVLYNVYRSALLKL